MSTAYAQSVLASLALSILFCCRKLEIIDNKKQEYHAIAPAVQIYEDPLCAYPQPAEFPGGDEAWNAFLRDNLHYPPDECIQGKVVVRFTIDTCGVVGDIHAVSGPEDVRPYAIGLIQKSPNWIPAVRRGQKIKDYKSWPITFRLDEE